MAATYTYRFAPWTVFHFGMRGVGIEETEIFCPADTLFSALCLTLREWERDGNQALETWLGGFPPLNGGRQPPLRLSSAFPYAGQVLFFPKPLLPANVSPRGRQVWAKALKKVSYVSQGILQAWLAQEELDAELDDAFLLHGGSVWVTQGERQALETFVDPATGEPQMWAKQTVPRVTIDRLTSQSSVYQAGVVRFRDGAGLYILADFAGSDGGAAEGERDRLTTLLTVLGHSGLGGERSSGYGQFELVGPEPFRGPAVGPGDLFLTLSPYHPTPAEVQAGVLAGAASYTLQTRRGWVGSPEGMGLRRRSVRLLGEGSVLPAVGRESHGDLADVTPLDEEGQEALVHKVWRYGIAFPLASAQPALAEEDR